MNMNDIDMYMAMMSTGWIKPVIAATVNLTFEVAQNTNVLNPYIKTHAKSIELMKMSTLIILEMMHPIMTNIPRIVIEMAERNIECLIFRLIP